MSFKKNSKDDKEFKSDSTETEFEEHLLDTNKQNQQQQQQPTTTNKQITIDEFQLELSQNLFKFRNENLFTDIFIYVEGVEFACHKVVLCAASSYFKAMFSCDLKESRLGKVYIENISPWTMKRLLDFIYTGKIDINYDNVIDIFNSAVMFQLYKLVDKCTDYIQEHIDLSNCVDINQFASMHHLDQLEKDTYQFILDNFMQLINDSNSPLNHAQSTSANNDFVRLSEATFTSLIKSDHLNVTREIYVYSALKRWTDYQINASKQQLKSAFGKTYENLFKLIRLNALSRDELEFILNNDKLVESNDNLTLYIKKHLNASNNIVNVSNCSKSLLNNHINNLNNLNSIIIRPSTIPRDYLCVLNTERFQFYDFLKSKWDVLSTWPLQKNKNFKLNGFSVCVNENKLYICGGYYSDHNHQISLDKIELSAELHCYDPIKNKWAKCGKMPRPRAFHTSLALTSNDTKNNFLFLLYGICYNFDESNNCAPDFSSNSPATSSQLLANTQLSKLAQCLCIDYYDINGDAWSTLKLNNSLISHHIFQPFNIRPLLSQINLNDEETSDNNEANRTSSALILNYLVDFQVAQAKCVLSLKNLIYILKDNCVHCYEFSAKLNQLNCLPYFCLPPNLATFSLAAAYGVRTPRNSCMSMFNWYSDDEDGDGSGVGADENDFDAGKCARDKKETVIFLLDANKSVLYQFFPAKNKLKKLPNLSMKHASNNGNNETSVLYIKSKIYVTGGVVEAEEAGEEVSNVVEVYDEDKETWSVFMNCKNEPDVFGNGNGSNSSNHVNQQMPLTKSYFKLKMSLF